MKLVKLFEEFIKEEEEIEIDGLDDISDEEADEEDIDIDIEIEDEEGKSIDETNERARPPKILPKQRKANSVKSKVVKELQLFGGGDHYSKVYGVNTVTALKWSCSVNQ